MSGQSTLTFACISLKKMVESKEIVAEKFSLKENPTNVFTKSLPRSRFKYCLDLINIAEE